MPDSTKNIQYMQEANALDCCCPYPLCPSPILRSWNMAGSAQALGYFERDEDDDYISPWVIYKRRPQTSTWVQTQTEEYVTFQWNEAPRTELAWTAQGAGTKVCAAYYDRNFQAQGWLNWDGAGCEGPFPLISEKSEGSLTFTGEFNGWDVHIGQISGNGYFLSVTKNVTGAHIGGTPKPAPAIGTWPQCTYSQTLENIRHQTPNQTALTTTETFLDSTPSVTGGSWSTSVLSYEEGANYEQWVASTRGALHAAMKALRLSYDFEACPGDLVEVDGPGDIQDIIPPQPETGGALVTITVQVQYGYQFELPQEFLNLGAEYWNQQWDVAAFPPLWDAWDAGGRVGPEPHPKPELLAAMEWLWTGIGDRSRIYPWPDPPQPDWDVRIVNLGVVCYQSTTGTLPTLHGETYPFDDD